MNHGQKFIFVVLTCFTVGKNSSAAEWEVKGNLDQELQYNSNISLSPFRNDSVFGYLLTPNIEASRKTKVWDIAFNGLADIRRYDDSRWDCDNYNLNLDNSYRTTRSEFRLSGGYGKTCSYSQQISDTGLLTPNNQSENYQVSPSWSWQWTTRDKLSLNSLYSKTTFSNTLSEGSFASNNNVLNFSNNEIYSVNLGETHQWNRHLSVSGKLFYSNVQYSGSNASTQNVFGFELGTIYKINHFWEVNLGGGPRWVDGLNQSSNVISTGQNSSLAIGNSAYIGFNYADQISQFSIGYSTSLSPSAIGQTLQSHNASASYSYRLARNILLDFSGNFSNSQSISDQTNNTITNQFNRDFLMLSAIIGWEFAKNWELRGNYIYSSQEYQQDSISGIQNINVGTSDSHALMIFLTFSWDGIQSSHRERNASHEQKVDTEISQRSGAEKITRPEQRTTYRNITF